MQVILIRKSAGHAGRSNPKGEEMHFVPRGGDVIDPGDRLVLVGKADDLQKLIGG